MNGKVVMKEPGKSSIEFKHTIQTTPSRNLNKQRGGCFECQLELKCSFSLANPLKFMI